ncbi:MAG: FAD-dependent monooxygenase, partial [Cyanobacteria bacterium J06628_3]
MKKVAIVGGGPTGVTLALMLVQRGIAVTLVEAASDFNRVFRGEALMPSGLNAFDEMGLSTILEQIPHRKLNAWKFILDKKPLFKVDEPIETNTQSCTLFSQPPLLEALILEAEKYSHFEFIQGIAVKDLISIDNRVAGVKLTDGREITADIVIGADGRNSIVRQRAGLELKRQPKSMDILWFKLAAHPKFITENVFSAIGDGENAFAVFHGAEPGKLHLGWTITEDNKDINKNINTNINT